MTDCMNVRYPGANTPRKEGQETIATTTVNFSDGLYDNKRYILTGNISPTFSASRAGKYHYVLEQDGTGGHTVTWGGNVVFSGSPPQPSAAAESVSVFEFYYDGSNFIGS